MRTFFLLISLLVSFSSTKAYSQNLFPQNNGDVAKYTTLIEMPKAYISGICILSHNEGNMIYGSIFNEFGITAINFSYNEKKEKVKLIEVIKVLDKWYIKMMLKKDLKEVMCSLKRGELQYVNKKRHINYSFSPITTDSI